ncbi:MAG: acyltransferase [Bacteroidota bacterium]
MANSPPTATFVHPTAVVDQGAVIGSGTKVWHFCHLMGSCQIGANCILGQNTFVADGVVVGNGVKIQNNVSLYKGVELKDHVFIGPSAVFTNVLNPRAFVERKDEYRPTLVGQGATIGANAVIVCGNTIGEYAMIGAGSVVTKKVPAFGLVYGNPAVQKGWVSRAGERLQFGDNQQATCPRTQEVYQLTQDGIKLA